MASATPDLYGYLPIVSLFHQYQIILFGDRAIFDSAVCED